MALVLDSWALMAYFEDEPAAAEVERILDEAEAEADDLLLSAVNWGEIYYSVCRTVSVQAAEDVARKLMAMPIRVMPVPDDLALVKQAAKYKAGHRISYADCFAAALAKLTSSALVTGDEEFRPLSADITIHWLPR
ncbi:MAG: type II toxin-antitoxin system VapC family toxin [Tepidisphaeraceae bacterium]